VLSPSLLVAVTGSAASMSSDTTASADDGGGDASTATVADLAEAASVRHCCRWDRLLDGGMRYHSKMITDSGHLLGSRSRWRSFSLIHSRNALRLSDNPVSLRRQRGFTENTTYPVTVSDSCLTNASVSPH